MISEEEMGQITLVSKRTKTYEEIYVEVDTPAIEQMLRCIFGDGDYTHDGWISTSFTIKREVSHD